MPGTLLILLAAQALPSLPPAPPPATTAPMTVTAPGPVGRQQIFIAPSGEPFRAPASAPYPVADWFARADADHDGKLTEAEFVADFLKFFGNLDADHNGFIDSAELDRYETEMAPELHTSSFAGDWAPASSDEGGDSEVGQNHRALGSYMGADNPQGAGRFDLLRIPEPVASMDVALNGRINRQEAQDAAEYRFSLLDTQHHGYLALTDLPETFVQSHHGGVGRGRGGHGGRGGGHGGRGGHGNWRGGGGGGGPSGY